jgi:hypothetical protein
MMTYQAALQGLLHRGIRTLARPIDATTLLWRLADEGVDVGNRWFSLSDAIERPWQPGFCPYVDLHAAMAHLRAGQRLRADRLMRSVELGAAENHPSGIRTRNVTMPLLRAIDVWGGSDRHTWM